MAAEVVEETVNVVKGTRVIACWFQASPFGTYSLSGMQPKVSGGFVEVVGVCRHFRGDDPVNPKEVRVYIDAESGAEGLRTVRPHGCTCDHEHIELKPEWIRGVLGREGSDK